MAFASIAEDIQGLSKRLGLSPDLVILEAAWEKEIGSMSQHAEIMALENATLIVGARSHAVLQELSLRRKELVRKLNKHLPGPFVKHMALRLLSYGC